MPAASGQTFENRNPADRDDLVGLFPKSDKRGRRRRGRGGEEGVSRAGRTRRRPRRAEVLYAAGEILKRDKEKLARLMTREMGKVLAETRGDVQEAIDMAFLAAGEGRRLFGFTTPSELPNKFAMCIRQPVGRLRVRHAVELPDGDPGVEVDGGADRRQHDRDQAGDGHARLGRGARARLRGGRACRPASSTSSWARAARSAIRSSSIPDVKVVSYTGSTEVGRRISQACAPTFKRLHLEMGGKNAILVMEDADVDLAVDGAVWGAFGTTGQRCTASSRLLVHRGGLQGVRRQARGARRRRCASATASIRTSTWGRASRRSSARPWRSTSRSARRRARSC